MSVQPDAPEEFIPYGLHSIHVPLGMVPYRGLSWGAKSLYGRLALFRGRKPDGFCNPGLDRMAAAMGVSVDTVERFLRELIDEKFIRRQRRGRQQARVVFLPHPCLVNSAGLRNQESDSSPQGCGVDDAPDSAELPPQFRSSAPFDSANLPGPYKEENFQVQLSGKPLRPSLDATVEDEDVSARTEDTRERAVGECLLEFVRAAGIKMPSGQPPVTAITAGLSKIGANVGDLVNFLKDYSGRWKEPPGTWKHILVSFERWASNPNSRANRHRRIVEKVFESQVREAERRAARAAAEAEQAVRDAEPHPVKVVLRAYIRTGLAMSDELCRELLARGGEISMVELRGCVERWRNGTFEHQSPDTRRGPRSARSTRGAPQVGESILSRFPCATQPLFARSEAV